MRKLEFIAIFMICLVVSLPIYSASVYANILTYPVNKDNVQGYRAANDKTTIIANISQAGVAAASVKYVAGNTNVQFNSCKSGSTYTECKYDLGQGRMTTWKEGKWDYSVTYPGETSGQGSIIVDTYSPNVTIINLIGKKEIEVSYSIKELSYETANTCSAVKTVNFYLAGQLLKSLALNLALGTNCDLHQYAAKMNASSTNNVAKQFCIEAIDNVGNKGKTCQGVIVDAELPDVSNIQIINPQNKTVTYLSPKYPFQGKIRFTMNENNFVKASSYADASEFTFYEAQKVAQKNMQINCNPSNCGGTCTCAIDNVWINLPAGGSPSLKMHLADLSGNSGDIAPVVAVLTDNEAPQVIKFTAAVCGDKTALGKFGNTLTAVIKEAGSGLSQKKIFIDLTSVLGAGFSKVSPNDCTQSADMWVCTWGPFNADQAVVPQQATTLSIPFVFGSQDDAGNGFTFDSSFSYDPNPPTILGNKIIAGSSLSFGELISEYPTSGGTIELRVNATDELAPLKATADFSSITMIKTRNVVCTDRGAGKECKFTFIGPLFSGPSTNVPIPVNVTDCVGNVAQETVLIDINEVQSTTQNYFDYKVNSISPAQIDRQTLSVIPHIAYAEILRTGSTQMIPIVQDVYSCGPDSATNYLDFNVNDKRAPDLTAYGNELYAKLKVQRAVTPPDNLTINCVLRTISRSTSSAVISRPEYDNVTFTLHFYNSLLGTIDKATQDKINGVKSNDLVKGKWIGMLDKAIGTAENFCRIVTLLETIGEIFSGADLGMSWMQKIPVIRHIYEAFKKVADTYSIGDKSIIKKLGGFCSYVSCKKSLLDNFSISKKWLGWLQKYHLYVPAGKETQAEQKFKMGADPKDSLILSVATLCLPGIVSNLQKARAIECSYIICMKTEVPSGVPVYFCDAQRASAWCKYVYGEMFNVIPFAMFFDDMIGFAKNMIKDPLYAASTAIFVCTKHIDGTVGAICKATEHTSGLVSAVKDLFSSSTWKAFKSTIKDGDVCSQALAEETTEVGEEA